MIYLINRETKEHRVYKSGDVVDYRIWKIVEADADGWIPWNGGECPLPDGALHEVKSADGQIHRSSEPEEDCWDMTHGSARIIAYRPILDTDSKAGGLSSEEAQYARAWQEHYKDDRESEAPEWAGDLPPVGCECELLRGKEWVPVEITGKGKRVTVFRRLCNYGLEEITEADATEFRPIRSEEEVAVRAMADVYRKAPHLTIYESIKCVYAAIRDGEVPGVMLTGNPRR